MPRSVDGVRGTLCRIARVHLRSVHGVALVEDTARAPYSRKALCVADEPCGRAELHSPGGMIMMLCL
jgi:hypothetical protein